RGLVPQHEMVEHALESHLALNSPILAKMRRDQNSTLLVDLNFVSVAEQMGLIRLHVGIETVLLANSAQHALPFARRIERETFLFQESVLRDKENLIAVALQQLAKAHRDTDATLVVDGVVVSPVEAALHCRLSPRPHNIPPVPTLVKQIPTSNPLSPRTLFNRKRIKHESGHLDTLTQSPLA